MDNVTWGIIAGAGAAGAISIFGEHIVKGFPSYISAGVFAALAAILLIRAMPIDAQPVPKASFLIVIGLGLFIAGLAYHFTAAHWKGREHYIQNLDRMIISGHKHIQSLIFAQDDKDYFARQNRAHQMLRNQAQWVNQNFGGATALAFVSSSGGGECANTEQLTEIPNQRRCEYIRAIRGRVAFLEKLKAEEKWPKSPNEIVKDPDFL